MKKTMTLKEHRQNIISKISMTSDNMDWDYAIELALEWIASDEQLKLIKELGKWNSNEAEAIAWINIVETLLEKILNEICYVQ